MISIFSTVTDGRLNKVASKEIADTLKQFEGKRVEVIIKRLRSTRSSQQNRFYWGVVVSVMRQAFKDIGYILNTEETHTILKDKFMPYTDISTPDGEFISKKYKSTTELTKTEFGEYIEAIQRFAAESLNVTIPDPNTQAKLI